MINECLVSLARAHPLVKFIKCVATKVVDGYQDVDCPGLIIYKDGAPTKQMIPANPFLGGKQVNVLTIEWVLAQNGIVETEQEYDPRDKMKMMNILYKKGKDAGRGGEEGDYESDEGDDREYMNNQFSRYR